MPRSTSWGFPRWGGYGATDNEAVTVRLLRGADALEVVVVLAPGSALGDLPHAGVAVVQPNAELTDPSGRLKPIESATDQPLTMWENNTILEFMEP